ncbi:MAG TPA: VCBS repeat-containing protein, partial [Gemmatimonadetes bacterium]|nr:VCBS repeat-containing protein [Gemmatimonadota bacterium]
MKISMGVFFLVVGLGIALLAAPAFAGPPPSGPVALGDVSGDGRVDVVVSGGTNDSVLYVYVTDATGLGVDATESAQIAFLQPGWVVRAVADFNNDDHADILIENTNVGETEGLLYVMITDSTTAVGAPVALDAGLGVSSALVPAGFAVVGVGDSNGSG